MNSIQFNYDGKKGFLLTPLSILVVTLRKVTGFVVVILFLNVSYSF